jgi:hypothetical protein
VRALKNAAQAEHGFLAPSPQEAPTGARPRSLRPVFFRAEVSSGAMKVMWPDYEEAFM